MAEMMKILLLCSAAAIFFLSLLTAGAGAYALTKRALYDAIFVVIDKDLSWKDYAAVCLGSGIAGVLVAVLGFCSVWKNNPIVRYIFVVLAFLLFTKDLVMGGLGMREGASLKEHISNGMIKTFTDSVNETDIWSENDSISKAKGSWDRVQKELLCCGVDDYKDYDGDPVPKSCGFLPKIYKNRPGCEGRVIDELKVWWHVWAGGDFASAAFKLAAILFVAWESRNKEEGGGYSRIAPRDFVSPSQNCADTVRTVDVYRPRDHVHRPSDQSTSNPVLQQSIGRQFNVHLHSPQAVETAFTVLRDMWATDSLGNHRSLPLPAGDSRNNACSRIVELDSSV